MFLNVKIKVHGAQAHSRHSEIVTALNVRIQSNLPLRDATNCMARAHGMSSEIQKDLLLNTKTGGQTEISMDVPQNEPLLEEAGKRLRSPDCIPGERHSQPCLFSSRTARVTTVSEFPSFPSPGGAR